MFELIFNAILAAGSIYFLEKGEEELYRNESVSYFQQEGLHIDLWVRE
jgi:hypothetical protein